MRGRRKRNYMQMPTLEKKAIELYRNGTSYKDITKTTGLSRKTIYRWAKYEKRRKNNKADLIDTIILMYKNGLNAQGISDKLGSVSQQIVSLWIRQGGLARKRGPIPIPIEDIAESDVKSIRESSAYTQWRTSVFERDGFKCQYCGQVGRCLEAHHILAFAKYPTMRFVLKNGVTLCKKCHKILHAGQLAPQVKGVA